MKPFSTLNDYLLFLLIISRYSFLSSSQIIALFKMFCEKDYSVIELNHILNFVIKNRENLESNLIFSNFELYVSKIDNILRKNKFRFVLKRIIKSCVFCNSILDEGFFKNYESVIYFQTNATQLCDHIAILCKNKICQAKHFYSFAVSDKIIQFYHDAVKERFISFTKSTFFEISLLNSLSVDIFFKHCSFNSFTQAFNYTLKNFFPFIGFDREYLEEERISEAFFYYRYLILINENKNFQPISFPFIYELETTFGKINNDLSDYFIKKWNNHKCLNVKNCMRAVAIDGNHKIHRLTCSYGDIFINTQETSPLQTGCLNSPLMGSFYCKQHSENFLYLKFYEKKLRLTFKQIYSHRKGKVKTEGLILHDSIEKNNTIYLLVSYEDKIPFFITTNQVSDNFISLQAIKSTGSIEEQQLSACNSSKFGCFPCDKKTKSVGTFVCSYNCGIIAGYSEIFKHETVKQAFIFALGVLEKTKKCPNVLIYDNGCKLKKYVQNKSKLVETQRLNKLKEMKIMVDRFHYKTHVDEYCKKNCNPYNCLELVDLNTSVAEQINSWFSRYKNTTKYMNYERFVFFLFFLFDFYNEEKINKKT